MKKHKYYQIFGLLILLSVILLTGCGGGGNGGGGPTTSTIIFELPEYYEGWDQEGSYPIPEEKEVRFYTLSQPDFDETFLADYYFTGKTGSDEIKCILPDSLKGQARYICAVIFLEDEDSEDRFDPEEKSGQEIIEAIGEGKILLGFAVNPDENPKLHTFAHGVTIKDFIFIGK